EEAFAMAEEHFGTWRVVTAMPEYKMPEVPAPSGTQIYLVDRAGDQAQIRVAQALPKFSRKDSRYFATRVVNQYFGGSFGARLNKTIRVDKGLTYGAGGGVSANRFGGQLYISTFSKNPTAAETVQTILDEVNRLMKEPASAEELSMAQRFLAGNFAISRETPLSIVGDLWLVKSQDLPENYLDKYLAGIANTTSQEAFEAANGLVDPAHLTIVVVGPASELKEGLEKIAPVTVIPENG
ncbi:insulinase family protein, partial [Candidatus Poribacteria bacterium]|nr:insulinase family protein [Candidatus Poribacteria bacterium]